MSKVFKKFNTYFYFFLGIVLIFFIGYIYVSEVDKKEEKKIRDEMLVLNQTFANVVDIEKFKTLKNDFSNTESPEYKIIREKLLNIGYINKAFGIRWIYTMVPIDGQIVFSVDSIPSDSPDYSDPGDFYTDASSEFINDVNKAWTNNESSITEPYVDQWGNFISIISPTTTLSKPLAKS